MIVALTARYISGNKKDIDVLRRVLAALGMESGSSQDPKQYGSGTSSSFVPAISVLKLVTGSGVNAQTEISVQVSDPLLALQIVKQAGVEIVESLPDEDVAARAGFLIKLPSGARVHIGALPVAPDSALPAFSGGLNATGKRFGIVVARFNAFITERLLQGAYDGLVRSGALRKDITIVRVPGAFEIPSAARTLAETKTYDAILCIGCLLRGDTAHYDVIVNEVTRGIGQSAQETGVYHAFGVLTCDTLEQAIDRAGLKMGNKGLEAATAAIEMANLQQVIRGRKAPRRPGGKTIQKNPQKTPRRKPVVALRRRKK